jgi:hypothetical protein
MEISITRALNELKLLDKRITKTISNNSFCTFKIGDKINKAKFQPIEEFQSITDLIKNRASIKSKIMESNAKTRIKVNGIEMLVIEAIEMKSAIKYKQTFLRKMKSDFSETTNEIERCNKSVNQRLDNLLQANFGKDSQAKDSEYEAIAKPFLTKNEAKIVDPIDIQTQIEKMENDIDGFLSDVDFALSESNSLTKITI